MAKQTLKIESLKAWRSTLKTKIVEKSYDDSADKGIKLNYSKNAKNINQ